MEISGIDRTKSVSKLQKNEHVAPSQRIEDRLSISSESEKKALWVEMLNEMPDVRPEKIEAALRSSPTSQDVAHALIHDL